MHKSATLALATLLAVSQAGAQAASDGVASPREPAGVQQRDRTGRDQGREEQTERTSRTIRIGANGELDVANVAGDITVTRGGGTDVTLDIVKTARAPSAADAREMLALVQVDVAERAGRAEVRTRYPDSSDRSRGNRRNINVTVAFAITAPATARIIARSVSGTVTTRDIKGDLTLESVSGNLVIAGADRIGSAKTISGDVTIGGSTADGPLEASSVSGTVSVRQTRARSLALRTISGNLVADDVTCDRVDLQSLSGEVEWAGALSQGGRYSLTSHSGNIRVAVPSDRGFELQANSFSGSIRSDLPLSGQVASQDRQRSRRALRGVYGNGSAVLDVTTFSGAIVIAKR